MKYIISSNHRAHMRQPVFFVRGLKNTAFLFLLALIGLLPACTSMEGDFGRPDQKGLTLDLMEKGGEVRAKLFRELYSDFNGTDEEKQMRDMAWNLIRPSHARDWVSDDLWNFFPSVHYVALHVLTETQRTRLTSVVDTAFEPKYYYKALRKKKYASHHIRYDRVTTDIEQDRESLDAFIPIAERVVEMDKERMAAISRLSDLSPTEMKNAYARVDENRRFIGWVWRALRFRLQAYAYAIKRLEIETPSPKVRDAHFALSRLNADFQAQNLMVEEKEGTRRAQKTIRRSRYSRRQWAKEDPNLVK